MKTVFFDRCRRLRSGWQLALALLSMILIQEVVFSVAFALLQPTDVLLWVGIYLLQIALVLLLFGLMFRMLYKRQDTTSMDCFRFSKKSGLYLLGGLVVGAAAFSLAALPMYLNVHYSLVFNGVFPEVLGKSLVQYIMVGFLEEITTRGAMQHALMRFGKWPSLIIISVAFGLLHLANPEVTFVDILGSALAGLMLGLAMYTTNSIAFPIGIHSTWNWVQSAVYGISASGTTGTGSLFTTAFAEGSERVYDTEASLYCCAVLALLCAGFVVYGHKKGRFAIYDRDRQATLAMKKTPYSE